MLINKPPSNGGQYDINTPKPKPPSRFLWGMEIGFIFLSILTVIAFSGLLYLSANNNKKAGEAEKVLQSNFKDPNENNNLAIIAKNEPAVVRIATTYCPNFDLRLNNVSQNFSGGCSAGYGSGFIISPEGYVATNGHVVKASVGEVLQTSIEYGNLPIIKSYLDFLVKTKLINQNTANDYYARAAGGDIDAIRAISASLTDPSLEKTEVKENSQESFYAIQLSDEAVAFDPKNIKNFEYDRNIVQAKLIDSNYDPYENVSKQGFSGSDVAILKIDGGSNYPFNSLGSINSISEGSKLTVVGFPGSAENDLVSKSQSLPTTTQGTVSSIRNANGTNNKLIQTDTTIAKGNSGGPAYDSLGNVVGLATYITSDANNGSAKINYMRDIQDIKDLLNKNGIKVPISPSGYQKSWEQSLAKFSKAYYTSAITDFKKLKEEYPQNRLIDKFIARAEEAKSKGQEATDPNVYLYIIIGSVALIFIPTAILFFVVTHHHKRRDSHNEYLNTLNTNEISSQQSITRAQNSQEIKSQISTQASRRNVDMLSHAKGPSKKQ